MNAKSVRRNEIDGLYEIIATSKKNARDARNLSTILVKFVNDPELPIVIRTSREAEFSSFLDEVKTFLERVELFSEGMIGRLKEVELRNKNLNEIERMHEE